MFKYQFYELVNQENRSKLAVHIFMCNKSKVFKAMDHSPTNPTFPNRTTVMPLVIVNLQW